MKNDRHATAISYATITEVHGQISVVLQTLAPHTITLTPYEHQAMLKNGG
ncbi:MAG: hypothetical protein LBG43_05705 [Treponema sp.]|nr:hypothetical protein [Treponema sp.]